MPAHQKGISRFSAVTDSGNIIPATALKDRHTKFDIYQQQQIPYYLLVDVDQKEVEAYRLNEQKVYEKIAVD